MTLTKPTDPTRDNREAEAIEYVQNLKRFHINRILFAVIVPVLVLFNLWVTPDTLWVIYVAIGWGVGIALQALVMFGLFGADWKQRQFRKRIDGGR